MQSRREFLKNAALLSGSIALWGGLEESIQKALAIEPRRAAAISMRSTSSF